MSDASVNGEMSKALALDIAELAERFGVPGVSLGVDVGGQTISLNYGVTHLDHPLPIDGDTLFQIASMSKPFTATLVMMMVEEGLVELEDPVAEYIPDFALPGARIDRSVTVRQLLTHTAGWDGDYLLVHPVASGRLADAPAAMSEARQMVAPGTAWTYCNSAYTLAGRLVEVVTGHRFGDALKDRILVPLRMKHTAIDADGAIQHRVAMRHLSGRGDIAPMYDAGWQPGWALQPFDLPVGGMISTTNDLLTWLRCWLDRGADDELGLARRSRNLMCDEQVEHYNPSTGQAIGWGVRVHPGGTVFGHGGLTAGYCSYSMFSPELDLAAVVLTNSTSGTALCTAITERVVELVSGRPWAPPEPMVPAPDTSALVGRYTGAFGVVTVSAGNTELQLTIERHPVGPGEWQPPREPSRRAVMYAPSHAVVTAPQAFEGTFVDFAPTTNGTPCDWIRTGGRIHTRL